MKKLVSVCLVAFLSATTVFSQSKKEVLLTLDGKPVYADEFVRVYKKNLDLVQDESQKDIDGYLQLFIDYKLKIAEAEAQGLDQDETFQKEFSKYRDQLSRNYLFENQISEKLAREAYERSKEEIDASHILVRVDYEAVPSDTLAAYNKIKNIRERALKGEDFSELAKNYSEEPGAKKSAGHLGYFSVFDMVYPFESAAYNTKEGEISDIIRTSFGYHILKVNDRRERMPKLSVSHIMISDKKGARDFDPKERINEILAMVKQGESFEKLAKQFSDDKNSAIMDGKLKPFRKGELRAPEFEEAAYALKNPGDISQPVKTDFGWHIIRLNERFAEPSFEDQYLELEKKVNEGDRSKIVSSATNKRIMEMYGFKKGESFLPYFDTYVGEDVLKRKWTPQPIPASENKTLFTIGDRQATYSDFANYIEQRQKTSKPYRSLEKLLVDYYDEFRTKVLKDYFKERLEFENEEYAAILGEYRDGLLIFDVMDKNIWQRAKNDTLGLKEYFAKSKSQYNWKERVDAEIYAATSESLAQEVQQLLQQGKTDEDIKAALNTQDKINVIETIGTFEVDARELPQGFEPLKGVSKIYQSNDSFFVVKVNELIPPGPKDLEDVKGKVLSNFQNDVEDSWMRSLHNKYKVEVNKKTLRRIKKRLK